MPILRDAKDVQAAAKIQATVQATLKGIRAEQMQQVIEEIVGEIAVPRRDVTGRLDRLETFLRSKLNDGGDA